MRPTTVGRPESETRRDQPFRSAVDKADRGDLLQTSPPPSRGWEVWALRQLLRVVGNPPVTLRLWNGAEIAPDDVPSVGTIHIRCQKALWKLVIDPLFQFGQAYANGDVDVEGDMADVLAAIFRPLNTRRANGSWLDFTASRLHRPRGTSLTRSRDNIHQHYDIGNDFYALWLDEQLVYTCAYFAEPGWSLEQAQVAKMDHVCRKLRIRRGDRVVEAGCGWGALALHIARKYGAKVTAFNISHEQILYARRRARDEGLADRVTFVEDDWRNIDQPCDVFVSVGMLEHVGKKNYEQLGRVIHRCLQPDGRGLIHSIGQNWPRRVNPWIERYIFPGAYPPTLAEAMAIFEPYDFSVQDVENLRLHYAETLRHWHDRYEDAVGKVRDRFGERFVRMWRLYLCGSIAAFESGSLQLFQIVFTHGRNNDLPRNRAWLYDSAPPSKSES